MDVKKAQAVFDAAVGLKYWEWRAIADMIDREFHATQATVQLSEAAANDALYRLRIELPAGR